jgi:predicted RNase H-like nuclease (RuvC/YqgF family)
MTKNKEHITTMHTEHQEWKKELAFARDEMETYRNRLGEVAQRNNVTKVLAQVEQIQNQIIRQNEVIDEIDHDINLHEDELVANAKANNVAVDHRQLPDHTDLRERMETFKKLFSALKADLNRFLSETL